MDDVDTTVCWDRTERDVIGVFHPRALGWLRIQLTGYRRLLEWRYESYTTEDETAAALGAPLPDGPAEYPPLVAALREVIPEDEPEPVRLWWEPDVVRWLYAGTEIVLESLPETGGVVVLPERYQVEAWQVALANMRVVYAVASGVWPVPKGTEHKLYTLPERAAGDLARDRALTEWLGSVIDGLENVLQPAPA